MNSLSEIVRKEWELALDEGDVVIPTLATRIISEYSEELENEKERLFRGAIIRLLKEIAQTTADDSGQLELFGFPNVIAVPSGSEYIYMRATAATLDKLEAGAEIRRKNVVKAQTKLDTYEQAVRRVRPIMEGNSLTLMDVIRSRKQAV